MDVGSIPTTPTNLERNEMQTFVIEYTSCEGNFRWMTIEAESSFEAEDRVQFPAVAPILEESIFNSNANPILFQQHLRF